MKRIRPFAASRQLRRMIRRTSRARWESNDWLRRQCCDIEGDVLSIGSGTDADGEGDYYRNYFVKASSYTTSEVTDAFDCDLIIDVRAMPQLKDESYDCVFCSGVLEHVDNVRDAFEEITRILKTDGILLLGLPFRQAIHMPPQDYWRFTEHGIRRMLRESYEILQLVSIDTRVRAFPASYWVKAIKKSIA
jgi:SAM-dependent methyltransferase